MVNAVSCAYITFYAPFRMAGFTARNAFIEGIFTVLSLLATLVALIDLSSRWIGRKLQYRTFVDQSKHGYLRRQCARVAFPVRLKFARFLRSLKMERWENWPRVDAIIILSFVLQYSERFLHGYDSRVRAGVHWTFIFGLLRLVAGFRVLHFVQCAENNLMLRRQVEPDERLMLRILKLSLSMLAVIHFSACLWCIVARVELGKDAVEPVPSPFFPNAEILLGGSGTVNAYLHAIHWAFVNLAGIGDCESTPVSTFECVTTLSVHICGATLYTITTGNVVTILDALTKQHNQTGSDLSERMYSVPS